MSDTVDFSTRYKIEREVGQGGMADLAFEWLKDMVDQRDAWQLMYYLNVFPWYDPLRSDPRYQALAQRLGFPT